MAFYYGKKIESTWGSYIEVTSISTQPTYYDVKINYGIHFYKKHNHETKYESFKDVASNANSVTPNTMNIPVGSYNKSAGTNLKFGSSTYRFNRTTSSRSGYIKIGIKHSGSGSQWKGTSVASYSFTVAAKPSYKITYSANDPNGHADTDNNAYNWWYNGTFVDYVAIAPDDQTKWYNESITLSGMLPTITDTRFSFKYWSEDPNDNPDDPDLSKKHVPNETFTTNRALNLYAIWESTFPPYCSTDGFSITTSADGNAIVGFSSVSVNCTDITAFNDGEHQKEMDDNSTISLLIDGTTVVTQTGGFAFDHYDDDGNNYYQDVTLTATPLDLSGITAGTYSIKIAITDSLGKTKTVDVGDGTITFVDPTWKKAVELHGLPPQIVNNVAVLDTIQVWNYTANGGVGEYDLISGSFPITVVDDDPNDIYWTFDYVFDIDHVSNPSIVEPNINVKVEYKHYESHEKPYREAFFNTTRNQNYSNGIYNVMFIGGVEGNPNYTSRVWWSQINNPKYFPDTNYIEVGSNDTMVMGLTKVGDYLAVIKQSKTTDTAIYLAYPTSFEEETTFAVRQGVQGVGAYARYSFNILGDETLFLSPKGVMAIVPSQDEEHKVQNRSYFIDGRLLKEENLEESYSFVFDGKYYLAVNGVVYVLDGNQRNSWGNDKTNLVYECYYLDNIPARCFVKYNDQLVFSSYDEVCIVGDGYEDAYDVEDSEQTSVPVKAEWSTVFDDDGSIHFYKTMQKKGNVVSILPRENETPYKQVFVGEEEFNEDKTIYFTFNGEKYVRCTEDSVFVYEFVEDAIDADDFNENKTKYYTYDGAQYIQCTEESVYDAAETYYAKYGTYYIENRSNTKVYVRKDDKDLMEIERQFGLSSDIPSEMFLRKKFKKYKRLQFVIRNEAAEPFGVDSIVKNYTLGNYAKK